MKTAETVFVVPTYRLRDVDATIEAYDEHFWSNGHSVKMMVFDDSSLANHQKYFSRLESTKTVNDLYYVGPREKEQFLAFLNKKLRDRKLESLVRNLSSRCHEQELADRLWSRQVRQPSGFATIFPNKAPL
jgi:hypothetical protein